MFQFTPEYFESVREGIIHSKIEYLNAAGILPEVLEERHVVCRLPAGHMHLNHVGTMYAGSYFVFAEAAGANLLLCTYGRQYVPIIKSMSLDYLKPSQSDLIIDLSMSEPEARERIAYVAEHGKGRYPMEIPVMNAEGVHCATANIVYYLMKTPD